MIYAYTQGTHNIWKKLLNNTVKKAKKAPSFLLSHMKLKMLQKGAACGNIAHISVSNI